MTSRRGFLGSILALGVAPAIARASSLMPIIAPRALWVPNQELTLDDIGRIYVQPLERDSLFEVGDRISLVIGDTLTIAGISTRFIVTRTAKATSARYLPSDWKI